MNPWSPSQPNGWWPRLSADGTRVVYGVGGEVWVASWREGREDRWPTDTYRLYPLGWHGTVLPMVALVPPRPVDEPEIIATTYRLPALNARYARNGSWCGGRAADGGVVWFNGTKIVTGGWNCRCDGPMLAVATKAGIALYASGQPHSVIREAGEVASLTIRHPWVGYRQAGRAYAYNYETRTLLNVTAPGHSGTEATPMIVAGWVWNIVEHVGPEDATYIQGHPIEDGRVIVRQRPKGSQDWIDVARVGDEWIVASNHDGGVLVVEAIPASERLRTWFDILFPPEPPMPTPNHLPTVTVVRSGYPTNEDLGNKRAWLISNEVAWLHRLEGFGLRKKPDGNNYVYDGQGYAVDIVFHKPTLQFVDILGSSETLGTPQWSEVAGAVLDEWAPPIDPSTIDDDTPIPPQPPTDLAARVTRLEADLVSLREALAAWIVHER